MDEENVDVEKLLGVVPDYMKKVKCDTSRRTGPFKCAVKSCKNRFVSFDLHQRSPYKFHNFPTNAESAAEWIKRCKVPLGVNTNLLKVCSDHFDLDDYLRNYKEEIFNPRFKRELKPKAVPHKKLGNPTDRVTLDDFELECAPAQDHDTPLVEDTNKQAESLPEQLESCQNEVITLTTEVKKLKKYLATVKAVIKRKSANINKYRQIEKAEYLSRRKIFTKAQFRVLLGMKAVWSDNDFAQAFSLRHIGGKQCYLYLKNTLGWPLPSLSSVQMWAGSHF
ncbi:uncharacterized protein LOC132702499 [Cylas formicarius]|uniref:uncharacterized protein LOC132702499 n=1 Tax=Cylas formicarius TaxID=197179 RepID=UPI002958A060|nr:uncharacterized protein LOC132702499 [Cylas formicarius]